MKLILLFVLLNLFKSTTLASHQDTPTGEEICRTVVKTANGLVRGKYVKTVTGKDVCAYLGIPYAKPPLDELRFKRPQPAENWEGIFEAIKLPSTCTQTSWGPKVFRWDVNVSEDCLCLNIWVPVSALQNKDTGNGMAVMVWIHEGGFSVGSSTKPDQDGAVLAGETDVIVASMQYRLGPLGFLFFGNDDAPGNMGLLDQNLALKWINANIAEFRGNSKEITLFGESAGSMSISYHLLSPLSQGLFKRGIMMSGTGSSSLCAGSISEAVDFSYKVAEAAGCWRPEVKDDPNKSLSKVIECMRNADKFEINEFLFKEQKFIDVPALVIPDGFFLPDTMQKLLKTSNSANVDLIVGNTADEGSFFLLEFTKYLSAIAEPSIKYDVFVTILRHMFRDRPIYEQDAIISHYTNWKNKDDTNINIRRLVAAAGDYSFVCPVVELANKWSSNGANVYYYWFTHIPEEGVVPAKWLGSYHTADIDYIFGIPLQKSRLNEKNLSKKIQELFTNFAKTGVPSQNWTPYTTSYPVFLDLNATLISDETPSNIFGPQADDCAFWNEELPRLRGAFETCKTDNCAKAGVKGQSCSRNPTGDSKCE